MTVFELIEQLKKFPPDMPVVTFDDLWDGYNLVNTLDILTAVPVYNNQQKIEGYLTWLLDKEKEAVQVLELTTTF